MDDPWGSPWAAASEPPKAVTPSVPSQDLLCPPPRAFFGGVAGLTSQSPWGHDDSLGGSTGDHADGVAHAPGWNVWSEPAAHSSAATLKPDATAKASPIACPSSAATSPGLAPLRTRTSSIFRQVSPDPWAAESSWNDTPGLSTPISTNKQETLQEHESEGSDNGLDPNRPVIHVEGPGLGLVESTKGTIDEDAGGAVICQDDGLPVVKAHGDADKNVDEDPQDVVSRPSSTFSLDSENGPERQDSPVTSIDEESTFASLSRKGTSAETTPEQDDKQESPTGQTSRDPSLPQREASVEGQSSLESINEDDDPGDFGDFEDAESDHGQTSSLSAVSADSDRSTTPKATSKHALGTEVSSRSRKMEELVEKFGPIKFEVDLQRLDKLPVDIPEAVDENDPGAMELSDRVISDSFSSIEQRKTWYRISRYGSMRKHDSGEEDDYRRVNWKTSQLHDDTIRVVRRWIEEDSLHGKPTFGGGKRSSGFNWGSTTGPVDLDQVFKRKSSVQSTTSSITPLRRAPTAPVTSNSHVPGQRNAAEGSAKSPVIPGAASPRASFGWSSNGVESSTIASPRPLSVHTETPTGSRAAGAAVERIKSPVPNRMSLQLPPKARQAMGLPGSPIKSSPRPLSIHTDTLGDSRSATSLTGGAVSPAKSPALKRVSLQLPQNPGQEISGFCSPPMMSPRPMSIHTDTFKASRAASSTANRMSLPPPPKPKQRGPVVEDDDDEWGEMVASPRVNLFPTNTAPPKAKSAMTIDPWASADFSVFDQQPQSAPFSPAFSTASASTSASVSAAPYPSPTTKPSMSTTSLPTPPSLTHSRHASSSSAKLPSGGPKVVLGPVQSSTAQQEEQDRRVRDVVAKLPDLSYMLR